MQFRRLIELAVWLLTLGFAAPFWRMPIYVLLGTAAGMGLTVAHISRAGSYLSDSPETCMNCHVMTDAYMSWTHSSHAKVAVCTDCHLPHDNIVKRYAFKAMDGTKHSAIFIARGEPQVLQLSEMAQPVVQENCRRCHEQTIEPVHAAVTEENGLHCWDCHREVPHGRARSLSATPTTMRPQLPPVNKLPENLRIGGRPPRPQQHGDQHE